MQTKLYMPPIRPSTIPRPHLVDRLNTGLGITPAGFASKLTLASAPAGFGKTTLMTQWLSQLTIDDWQLSVAWVALDEQDNDPVRFVRYFLAALQTAVSHIGSSVSSILQASSNIDDITPLMAALLNDIATSDSRLILLLDDFHLITNNQIQEAVRFWLEHMPPQMHLIITSRIDPPFSLARWRVRQEVTEIRAADLRFSRGDTALFCNQTSQLNLTDSDITALETRTEGWIAGLQLAALSLSRQNPDERSK
ncbi:MAG: hypothetical protein GY943_03305, partial [Chloroflexi bacterium]|nr:hypothetical protein [Chloroflexota bacterium]